MTRIATETMLPVWEKYFHQVEEGETILVTKNDVPIAEIIPLSREGKGMRPHGLAEGEFEFVYETFNEPLPDDILKLFTLED